MKEIDSEICNPELCNTCQKKYIQMSSNQEPKIEHLREATEIKHAFQVRKLEVESSKSKEMVAISLHYLYTTPPFTQVDYIICHLKTLQWQRILILQICLPLGTYKPIEGDENDPHIAVVCEHVIDKVNLWVQNSTLHN